MTFRLLSAVCVLAVLSGCQWDSRPDGVGSDHSNSDGYSNGAVGTAYGGTEVVEPLGDPVDAPAPLTQPPPDAGTMDAPSAVDQTPPTGTDQ